MCSKFKVIYTFSKSALFSRGRSDRQFAIKQHLIEFVNCHYFHCIVYDDYFTTLICESLLEAGRSASEWVNSDKIYLQVVSVLSCKSQTLSCGSSCKSYCLCHKLSQATEDLRHNRMLIVARLPFLTLVLGEWQTCRNLIMNRCDDMYVVIAIT